MLIEADILEPRMESNTLTGIAKPFHNFTTAVDFPAALALFWFDLRSFRLRSVRPLLESIRPRLICQFAYVLKHVGPLVS